MVSDSVILSLYTVLVILITGPIMVAVLMRVKSKVKIWPFLLGTVIYFTFDFVCVQIIKIIFISDGRATSQMIYGNIAIYALFNAVVIGLIEGAGILIAFKKILVNYDDKKTPIMYGLGHACIEALLISGIRIFDYITFSTALNELGREGFIEKFFTEAQNAEEVSNIDIDRVIDFFTNMKTTDVLLLALNRFVLFAVLLFTSIMIFYSVKRETKVYFWLAVIVRGLSIIPGSIQDFLEIEDSAGSWILLLVTTAIVALAGFIGVKLYRNYDTERVLLPGELFKGNSANSGLL